MWVCVVDARCGGCGMCRRAEVSAGVGAGVMGAVLAASALLAACLAPGASADLVGPTCLPKAVKESRCRAAEPSSNDYIFYIDGAQLTINYCIQHISIKCDDGNVTLDSDALPAFPTDQPVSPRKIFVVNCPVPATASYTTVLAALNVNTASATNFELQYLPAHTSLRPEHFRHLPNVRLLKVFVSDGAPADKLPPLPHRRDALFSDLKTLKYLYLTGLELLPGDLPTNITFLKLTHVGFENITEILQRLTNLSELVIRDPRREVTLNVSVATALTNVTVQGAAAPQNSHLLHVAVYEWKDHAPTPWRECDALKVLWIDSVRNATRVALPDGWVAACHRLQQLSMERVPLVEVTPRLLANATKLKILKLKKCELHTLPDGLFDNTTLLEHLDLSDNYLYTLPSEIFRRPSNSFEYLRLLWLSNNWLERAALAALRPLARLTDLHLDDNPLGDLCQRDPHDDSPLRNLTGLEELRLKATGASRVCPEWRERMTELITIDLSYNKIDNLTFADLLWKASSVFVELEANPISRVLVSKHDNITAISGGITISINSAIQCDCDSDALRSEEVLGAFNPPLCCRGALGGLELHSVPQAQLQCPVEGAACPRGCKCSRAVDDAVTLACEGAGLRAPPRLPTLAPLALAPLHLLLANNRIATLGTADLPQRLMVLDLRNNSLRSLDAETLEAIFSVSERKVKLSGNQFDCTCGARARALVTTLHKYRHQVDDFETIMCTEHRPLLLANPSALCPLTIVGLVAGASALVVLLALGLAMGARPEGRHRLVRALRKLGVVHDRENRRFDAFVSFSHHDERFVIDELVARLERTGYRLCLHYRDWVPGEWIPAQIAASVRASRRTIAVVSEHFLRSEWARAEFREAHAAALRSTRPRLVVVLLADPAALAASAAAADRGDLCAFLAANTYVSRDDPYLWSKLERALPRPSGRGALAHLAENSAEDACTPRPDEAAPAPPPAGRTGLARIFPILSLKSPELHLANAGVVPAGQTQVHM